MNRLEELEKAELMVVDALELAGNAMSELMEIQSNNKEKRINITEYSNSYFEKLAEVKRILFEEIDNLEITAPEQTRRPGIPNLALSQWCGEVIAQNLSEIAEYK